MTVYTVLRISEHGNVKVVAVCADYGVAKSYVPHYDDAYHDAYVSTFVCENADYQVVTTELQY